MKKILRLRAKTYNYLMVVKIKEQKEQKTVSSKEILNLKIAKTG